MGKVYKSDGYGCTKCVLDKYMGAALEGPSSQYAVKTESEYPNWNYSSNGYGSKCLTMINNLTIFIIQ